MSSTRDVADATAEAVIKATYSKMRDDFTSILGREALVEAKVRELHAKEETLTAKEHQLVERESRLVDHKTEGRGFAVDIIRREQKMRKTGADLIAREAAVAEREWMVIRREREFEDMEAEVLDAKKRADRYRTGYDAINQELSSAQLKTERLENQVTALVVERGRYQNAFGEQAVRAEHSLSRQVWDNNKLSEKLDQKNDEVLDLTGRVAELNERVAFLNRENAGLRRKQHIGGSLTESAETKFPLEMETLTKQPPLHRPSLHTNDSSPIPSSSFLQKPHRQRKASAHDNISELALPPPAIRADATLSNIGMGGPMAQHSETTIDTPTPASRGQEQAKRSEGFPLPAQGKGAHKRALSGATPLFSDLSPPSLVPTTSPLRGFPRPPKSREAIPPSSTRSLSRLPRAGDRDLITMAGESTRTVSGGVLLRRKVSSYDLPDDLPQSQTAGITPSRQVSSPVAPSSHGPNNNNQNSQAPSSAGKEVKFPPSVFRPRSRTTSERYEKLKNAMLLRKGKGKEQEKTAEGSK